MQNTGTAALILGTPSLPDGYTITEPLNGTIAAGGSDTFTVQLNTATVGTFAGNISFATNVTGKNPFNFAVTGSGDATAAGDRRLRRDRPPSPAARRRRSTWAARSAARPALTKTFTVRNDGEQTLQLEHASLRTRRHFIVRRSDDITLTAGQTTTFTVTLNTDAVWYGQPSMISFRQQRRQRGRESLHLRRLGQRDRHAAGDHRSETATTDITSGKTTPIDVGSAAHNAARTQQDVHHPQRRGSDPYVLTASRLPARRTLRSASRARRAWRRENRRPLP